MLSIINNFYRTCPEHLIRVSSAFQAQQQSRGKARTSFREAKKKRLGIVSQRQKARLARREEKTPELDFMARLMMQVKRDKAAISPCLQHPARQTNTVELPDAPNDDVYLMNLFKNKVYTVSEAIDMHRDAMQPEMMNHLNAPVRLRLELNMNIIKKNRYVPESREIIMLPNPVLNDGSGRQRSILAFVKDPVLQGKALEYGAETAVGQDYIKKVMKGTFRTEDYDYIVCYVDMFEYITSLRSILKTRLPTKLNGAIGSELEPLIKKFLNGTQFEIIRDVLRPEWGLCDTVIGTLDMTHEQIEENVKAMIENVCEHRQLHFKLGHYINRALLMVVPGKEFFEIDFIKYSPEIPAEVTAEEKEAQKREFAKKKQAEKLATLTFDEPKT